LLEHRSALSLNSSTGFADLSRRLEANGNNVSMGNAGVGAGNARS
jgi:hypothetical protein